MKPQRILIDQGNSYCKIAFAQGEALLPSVIVGTDKAIEYVARNVRMEQGSEIVSLYCCVGRCHAPLREWLSHHATRFIMLDQSTPVPIAIDSYDRGSLGMDRVAASVGALTLYPEAKHLLVIDIGTAITFDSVDRERGFIGGNISAGPGLRAAALHGHTARLPYVELGKHEVAEAFATDTHGAIANGVFLSVRYEIEGYIAMARKSHPDVVVLMTGGYAPYFAEKIKNVTFVERLTMVGLNRIVSYNEEIEIQ